MKNLLSVIFSNLLGFDMLVFILAGFTAFIYRSLKTSADKLYKKMHLTVFVPHSDSSKKEAEEQLVKLKESEVIEMRKQTGKLYSLFVNLTGIFPLMGILGTVISLLGLVADMDNVQGNFYSALTSTFWGLVFAIIFKVLDGVISSEIEDNERSVELYLSRQDGNKEEQ